MGRVARDRCWPGDGCRRERSNLEMAYPLLESNGLSFGSSMRVTSRRARKETADERALVRRMVAGDRQAFEQFADSYIPALYRFAASRLRHDPELTREIAQATLVRAIEKIGSFRGEASLTTWLCACCKSEISAHFRKSRARPAEVEWSEERLPEAASPGGAAPDGPESSILRDEDRELVHVTLDRLPARYARVLEWKYLDDLSVREIAERVELKMKAAESLLTRARNSFREVYARLQLGHRHE